MRRLALVFALAACGAPALPLDRPTPSLTLRGTDGKAHDLARDASLAEATVLVFFDAHCPCFSAHEPRLAALAKDLGPRVVVLLVDSEVGGSLEQDARSVASRGLPFPMLRDDGARLAKALGAEYASYSVVLDRTGTVRYAGGIDDDRSHLTDSATPYLREALEDVLAGRPVRRREGKALGCTLALQ